MNDVFEARYCDGETLRSHLVGVRIDDAGRSLLITGEGLVRAVPLAELRLSERLGRVPFFVRLPGGGMLEVPADSALGEALEKASPVSRLERGLHWLESRAAVAAAATVLLVAAVGAAAWQGLPRLARRGAHAVPLSMERQAGETALQIFRRSFAAGEVAPEDVRRVQRQLTRLEAARPLHVKPSLLFVRMNAPNAFALPGGFIVVTEELVDLAGSDEELAAVLAHEIGHIERRHGLQSVLRNSAALILVSTVTGDLSTITTFSATLPFVLLQYGYNRDFEREADAYAVGLLRDASIDPVHLARILRRLEESRPKNGNDFSYLSTHPNTEERVKLVAGDKVPLLAKAAGSTAAANPGSAAKPAPGATAPEATALTRNPRRLHAAPPVYPVALRKAGVTGEVETEFIVDTDGNVRDEKVLSSTDSEFEEAALVAIRQWKFSPGFKNGVPVNSRMRQTIAFTLNAEPEGERKE